MKNLRRVTLQLPEELQYLADSPKEIIKILLREHRSSKGVKDYSSYSYQDLLDMRSTGSPDEYRHISNALAHFMRV